MDNLAKSPEHREELVQNIVMDEDLVQNIVMDEEFVKNIVMGANIDPKVEMDLSIFKIGGGTCCNQEIENCWKNPLGKMNFSCCLRNSKQRFIPRDTLRRGVDATVTICMNIQEDVRRGENPRG